MARKQKLSAARRSTILNRIEERVLSVNLSELVAIATEADMAVKLRADEIYFGQFPAEEMAILKKHRVASHTTKLSVIANNEEDDISAKHDEFEMTEKRPVPENYNGRRAIIRRDDVIFDLERKAQVANDTLKAQKDLIMADYRAIVSNSTYFEDLVELIPEVAKFENELYPSTGALSVLTRDVVERVRADQERLTA